MSRVRGRVWGSEPLDCIHNKHLYIILCNIPSGSYSFLLSSITCQICHEPLSFVTIGDYLSSLRRLPVTCDLPTCQMRHKVGWAIRLKFFFPVMNSILNMQINR